MNLDDCHERYAVVCSLVSIMRELACTSSEIDEKLESFMGLRRNYSRIFGKFVSKFTISST